MLLSSKSHWIGGASECRKRQWSRVRIRHWPRSAEGLTVLVFLDFICTVFTVRSAAPQITHVGWFPGLDWNLGSDNDHYIDHHTSLYNSSG